MVLYIDLTDNKNKIMRFIAFLSVVFASTLMIGCGQEVKFNSEGESFTYNCGSFDPKAETEEDLEVLVSGTKEALQTLLERDKKVTVSELESSINEAQRQRNYRRLEELMVEAKCEAESLKNE